MKNIFIKTVISIILVGIPQIIFSQNVVSEVIYKKHSTIDLTKKEKNGATKEKNEATLILAKSFELMKGIEYVLIFNKKEALFKETPSMNLDDNKDMISKMLSKSLGGGNAIFYTDLTTQKILCQKERDSKTYVITSGFSKFNWITSKETKQIGNYICYKATSTTAKEYVSGKKVLNITAWYSPKIPASFGPIGYGGLPGLILEIKIGNFVFSAKKVILNKIVKNGIKRPEGIAISEENYQKMAKEGFGKLMQLK